MSETVENSHDPSKLVESSSFEKVKREIKKRQLVEKSVKLLEKNPDLTRDQVAEQLGVSGGTLSEAFLEVKDSKDMDLLGSILKKAIPVSLGLLFYHEDNLDKLLDKFSEFIDDNPTTSYMLAGLGLFWNQWIVPRIKDPKNDLSELEVFTSFMMSPVGQVVATGTLILPIISDLVSNTITNFGVLIKEGLENFSLGVEEKVDEIESDLGLGELECNGQVFPSVRDWISEQPKAVQSFFIASPPSALAAYGIAKKRWKKQNCE